MNNEINIEPISEHLANTERLCEIRFDCLVTMHDYGYPIIKNSTFIPGEVRSKTPQWFRANQNITLEFVKHTDPYVLGMLIKEMFRRLEDTIKKYENE
jgi:hypothetical protein